MNYTLRWINSTIGAVTQLQVTTKFEIDSVCLLIFSTLIGY